MVNNQYLSKFYHNKKIFITGHTGFKGSWLMLWLKQLGAEVKGYALPPENDQCFFNGVNQSINSISIFGDIRNHSMLKSELLSFEPDFVFHLAAQPLVRKSYKIPSETFDVNVTGTANLLEAVSHLKKKCTVVLITTDKVYENKESDILYKEEDILGGHDPYSASKACCEFVINSFRNSFFNLEKISNHQKGIVSVRAGNVIGGGDFSEDRIIPDIVNAIKKQQVIKVRNPNAVRPWQHVLEPLGGYLLVGALMSEDPAIYSGAYNFGPHPNDHLTVKELVELSINIWGSGSWQDVSENDQPHEAGLLKLDITKAKNVLNWEPKLNATQAIDWTIKWYKQLSSTQVDFALFQINEFMNM